MLNKLKLILFKIRGRFSKEKNDVIISNIGYKYLKETYYYKRKVTIEMYLYEYSKNSKKYKENNKIILNIIFNHSLEHFYIINYYMYIIEDIVMNNIKGDNIKVQIILIIQVDKSDFSIEKYRSIDENYTFEFCTTNDAFFLNKESSKIKLLKYINHVINSKTSNKNSGDKLMLKQISIHFFYLKDKKLN